MRRRRAASDPNIHFSAEAAYTLSLWRPFSYKARLIRSFTWGASTGTLPLKDRIGSADELPLGPLNCVAGTD
jgi:hypothetical protein